MKIMRGLFVLFCLTINTIIWFIPLFIMSFAKIILPSLAKNYLTVIGDMWVTCNSFMVNKSNKIRWDVRGLEHFNKESWYLIFANHQTWVDVVVLQNIFNGQVPFLKFFVKKELIWLPFLGIAFWALDMPFMKRYSKSYLSKNPYKKSIDLKATKNACKKFKNIPTSVVNFVEGTRFNVNKQLEFGSPYKHLMMPKTGGLALTLSSMGELFDNIIDVTIIYPNGPPSFWNMLSGNFNHVIVDIRVLPVESWLYEGDYQQDNHFRERISNWLSSIWLIKDERINFILRDIKEDNA